jgi:tRNA modification GTPase
MSDEDRLLIERLKNSSATVIAVLNKSDCRAASNVDYVANFAHTVSISAQSGAGMCDLEALVEQLFTDGALDSRRDAVLTNARQHASALSALEAVRRAVEVLRGGYPIDLCCTDAELAMSALCELDGRSVSEDIISEIFSHFCVGK